jgi:hypothetical protein
MSVNILHILVSRLFLPQRHIVDANIAIAGRVGVYSVDHIDWTGCCIRIQVHAAALGIAALEHLLEDTGADKLMAGHDKDRRELIRSHRRAAAPLSAPDSGPEVLVPVGTGLRMGLGGRMAGFECSLYTACRG